MKASKFLEANAISITETVPASRKLGRDDAMTLAKKAKRVVVAKGKAVREFVPADGIDDTLISAMLGPTGNLRAPLLCAGATILVGFNQDVYADVLG